MILWLSMFVRVVANPFSNVFQRLLTYCSAAPLSDMCVTHGLTLACLPVFRLCPPPAYSEFWAFWASNVGLAGPWALECRRHGLRIHRVTRFVSGDEPPRATLRLVYEVVRSKEAVAAADPVLAVETMTLHFEYRDERWGRADDQAPGEAPVDKAERK